MLLFEVGESAESGLGTDPTGDAFGYSKVVDAFKEAVKDAIDPSRYQTFFIKLEDQAIKSARSLAGGLEGYSGMLEKTMFNVYDKTISIGGTLKDTTDYAESFATQTGRIPALHEDIIVGAIKISKEYGISTKEVAAMSGEFLKVGLSQQKAVEMTRVIGNTARKYGVQASTLTKTVQENIKKAGAYTFKDGIKGLTEMAAQAQKFGIKMDSAFSVYKEFLDPDKAIDMASEISMLGGKFASTFGDPFKNMSMTVDEIQDSFIKAAQSSAVFNEKTGEFEIPRAQQQAMMAFTEKLGLEMDDFTSLVKQGAKEMKIMNEVGFKPNVSEEDKKFLSSIAEQKDGEWMVQLPGTDNWEKLSNIQADQINDFKTAAETKELSVAETQNKMLSIAERQSATLQQIRDSLVLKGGLDTGKAIASIADSFNNAMDIARKKIVDTVDVSTLQGIIETAETTFSDYINGDFTDHLQAIIDKFEELAGTIITGLPIPTGDLFVPASGSSPKVMSEGKIYEGVKNDQLMMGTDLDKTFEISRKQIEKTKQFADSILTSYDGNEQLKLMSSPKKSNQNLQNALAEKPTKLSELMTTTTNINNTNTQNLSGGFTITIDASKVPNTLDPTSIKNEVMKVMYQLGDEMKKQGVLNFNLK